MVPTRQLCAFFVLATLLGVPAAAQQRPLDTQDPEPIGAGRVLVESGAHDQFYPLSGLQGNLWQLPALGFLVGLSPIADFQLTGGPYNRTASTLTL